MDFYGFLFTYSFVSLILAFLLSDSKGNGFVKWFAICLLSTPLFAIVMRLFISILKQEMNKW